MTRSGVIVGAVVALVAFAAYAFVGLQLRPDFSLYVHHAPGLFPSPGGRLLGSLGPVALAAVNAGSAGAVVALLLGRGVRIRRLIYALPFLVWLIPAGVDALGTLAALVGLTAASSRSAVATVVAALLHPVAAVAPLARLGSQRLLLALPAVGVLVLALALTPYAGVLRLPTLRAMFAGLWLAGLAWSVAGRRPVGQEVLVVGAVAVAVALVGSGTSGVTLVYLRYLLPLVAYALVRSVPA
jgi:hypothetical protein